MYQAQDGLYLRPMGELAARLIPGAAGINPFVSPDGEWVGYFGAGGLRKSQRQRRRARRVVRSDDAVRSELGRRRHHPVRTARRDHARLRQRRHTGAPDPSRRQRGAVRPAAHARRTIRAVQRDHRARPESLGPGAGRGAVARHRGQDRGGERRHGRALSLHGSYRLHGPRHAVRHPVRCPPAGGDRRGAAARPGRDAAGRADCPRDTLCRFERRDTGLCHQPGVAAIAGVAAPRCLRRRAGRDHPARRLRGPEALAGRQSPPAHQRGRHLDLRHRLGPQQSNHARRRQPDGGVAPGGPGGRVLIRGRRQPGSVGQPRRTGVDSRGRSRDSAARSTSIRGRRMAARSTCTAMGNGRSTS